MIRYEVEHVLEEKKLVQARENTTGCTFTVPQNYKRLVEPGDVGVFSIESVPFPAKVYGSADQQMDCYIPAYLCDLLGLKHGDRVDIHFHQVIRTASE